MLYQGDYVANSTVYVYFDTVDGNGAPITISGLALADIKVYKNGSVTQRSSTAGFALLDTDGIDFDAITGIHGFSLDLSDNTDAGFWAAGNDYTVVIDNITVGAQTVSFIAATFSIENRASGGATAAAIADAVWDELISGHNVAGSFGKGVRQIKEGIVSVESTVNDAAATTTSFVTSLTSAVDQFYRDTILVFIDGALAGQPRIIADYNGTTKTVTVDEAVTSAPANGSGFIIIAPHAHRISQIANAILPPQNIAFSDIQFVMRDSADHITPKTGLAPSGTRSIDGGAFAAVTGTIAEIGNGLYQFDASAADMNGAMITFRFAAAGADDVFITVKLGM